MAKRTGYCQRYYIYKSIKDYQKGAFIMMDASFGVKGFFDYIPEPYSKFLSIEALRNTELQRRNAVKAKHSDMMFLLIVLMLFY